jgi:Peptidase family M50
MSILTHIWTITAHILPFLFVLSLLVFFHELGHFFIGRWFGVKVDVFSLGFGPEIFGFDAMEPIGDWQPCHSAAMSNFTVTSTVRWPASPP